MIRQLTHRWFRTALLGLSFFLLVRILYLFISTPTVDAWNLNTLPVAPPQRVADYFDPNHITKTIVVAGTSEDDSSWLYTHFPDWIIRPYVMDEESIAAHSFHSVPVNAGGESMAYLTYIIDHYDHLPDYSIFIRAGRYQSRNEDPMYDAVPVLRHLQLSYVQSEGYVNLRCTWTPGCPAGMQPLHRTIVTDLKALFFKLVPSWQDDAARTQLYYRTAFEQLLPGVPVPKAIGVPCCNQFALTRWKIRERPLEAYLWYRQWLINCPYGPEISSRIMEYTWHIMMGMPAVYCHDADYCFCAKFGICNLNCTAGECENRYAKPPALLLPENWPDEGPGQDGWPERDWFVQSPDTIFGK